MLKICLWINYKFASLSFLCSIYITVGGEKRVWSTRKTPIIQVDRYFHGIHEKRINRCSVHLAQRSSCCVSLFSRAPRSLFHAWVQENPMDSLQERSNHTPGIQFKEFSWVFKGTRKWKQPNFWYKCSLQKKSANENSHS